jgi:hypothetical protein
MRFVEDRFSWQETQRRKARRESSLWRRHAAWLMQHHWSTRICIVIGELTIAYLAFVFGMAVGVVLRVTL